VVELVTARSADRGCAGIHGEPAGRDTVFCGKPTVDRVWCAEHRAVVYRNPAPVRAPADRDDGGEFELFALRAGFCPG